MEHKRIGRCLLGAGIAAGIGGAAVFFVYLAGVVQSSHLFPGYQFVLVLVGLCTLGLLYGLALSEYMRICIRIGKNQSFCAENARRLFRISWDLFLAAGVWLLAQGAVLLPNVGCGMWQIAFFLFAVASAAMGVLAWAIGKLLSRAVELQEENDLTV
ncbi:MAG: DUF2975 domain-containing protein [Clostridiales bacterium]|nr:DUF2975 domain-containing protein [Clostridiales bacterium]